MTINWIPVLCIISLYSAFLKELENLRISLLFLWLSKKYPVRTIFILLFFIPSLSLSLHLPQNVPSASEHTHPEAAAIFQGQQRRWVAPPSTRCGHWNDGGRRCQLAFPLLGVARYFWPRIASKQAVLFSSASKVVKDLFQQSGRGSRSSFLRESWLCEKPLKHLLHISFLNVFKMLPRFKVL